MCNLENSIQCKAEPSVSLHPTFPSPGGKFSSAWHHQVTDLILANISTSFTLLAARESILPMWFWASVLAVLSPKPLVVPCARVFGWVICSSNTRHKHLQTWSNFCLWLHTCNSPRNLMGRECARLGAACCLCAYLCIQLVCTALWSPGWDVGISSSSSHLPATLSSWKLPSPSWYPWRVIVLNNSLDGWQSWHNKRMAECY